MKLTSIQKSKLLCSALAVALLAGCSSGGGSSSPTEPLPEFDGDLGFENVDPGYGNSAPEAQNQQSRILVLIWAMFTFQI
ncbi:hypothetical protein JCM19235_2315 [Vibrio maritimus]|uniref:Uncharacterized protein n=1 Tax=Vibrio maritimus TaxID=990268 RepID=A0A090SHE3_9VIBR|nr:hypothetical protein JCM19235_2315 [Vibrio maritimus]